MFYRRYVFCIFLLFRTLCEKTAALNPSSPDRRTRCMLSVLKMRRHFFSVSWPC